MTQYLMGQNREALDSLQQAERYRDPNRQKLLGYQFGQDPILSILSAQVLPLAHLGLVESATSCGPNFHGTTTSPRLLRA